MNILLYWYSATGNSARLALVLKAALEGEGAKVTLKEILDKPVPLDAFDKVGFCFPVMLFRLPNAISRFISKIPKTKKPLEGFALITHGGQPAKTDNLLQKALAKRGISLGHVGEILCEDSYIPIRKWLSTVSKAGLPDEGSEKKVVAFAKVIAAADKAAWREKKSFLRSALNIIATVSPQDGGKLFLGERYLDDEACIRCGLCEKVCLEEAITMEGERPLVTIDKCVGCCTCFNNCPTNAWRLKKFSPECYYREADGAPVTMKRG